MSKRPTARRRPNLPTETNPRRSSIECADFTVARGYYRCLGLALLSIILVTLFSYSSERERRGMLTSAAGLESTSSAEYRNTAADGGYVGSKGCVRCYEAL